VGLLTGVLSLAREPVRLTLRVWEFGLTSAASAAKLGLELLDQERSDAFATAERHYSPPPPPPTSADSPPAVPDELIPDHVDEQVVLVAEVAEEGAEDGVGPELHVDEPWDAYDEMTAPEIRDRLAAGDPALAAAVNLYETTHKSRRTVLEAAERALKS
jgi:hypothetical protein